MSGPKKLALFKDSPFGAPAPQPLSSDDDDSDTEFFSQSKRTYALLAAQEEERKKRKAEKATAAIEEPRPATPPSRKKQRTSDLRDDTSKNDTGRQSSEEAVESQISPVPAKSEPKSKDVTAQKPQGSTDPTGEIIELESDESSVEEVGAGQLPASQTSTGRPKRSNVEESNSHQEDLKEATTFPASTELPKAHESATPDPEANVVVSILITSNIPDTTALIVQRKLGQRLKEPRLEWCKRQGFDTAKTASVILTFRAKQIYDSTTCRALGIGVDASGNIVEPGEKDSIGDRERRIHMEATTREMLKQLRDSQSQSQSRRSIHAAEEEEAEALPAEVTGTRVRLILKSKGRDDLKLMVKDTHLISKLVNAYRKENGLEDSTTSVSIHFDGEELSPERSVADCDISDLDTLDVYEK